MSATTAGPAAATVRDRSRFQTLVTGRAGPFLGIGTALVLLLLVEAATQPDFFEPANLTNVARALAVPLVLALVMTFALLTGGVDLSIGSTLALAGTVYAKLWLGGVPAGLALVLALLFGGAIGFLVNGVLIGRLNMSFFVVTLGTLSLYRGIVFLWTKQSTVDMYDDRLTQVLGNDTIIGGHIPVGFLVAVALGVFLWLVLRFTTFGRQVYAVGGNREAARLSGVRTDWVIAAVYGICGLGAALAALMAIGRGTALDPNMGTSLELSAAAAVLLGGVALSGGVGSIWGAVMGVVLLELLANALSLAGLPNSWQLVVTGVILIIAVYLDRVRARANRT
jgi:ribose/xylose/arabinose/galactoside ABC-type transport system permease subunit